jgi:Zn ribbon nucleic-acid-binding protein
MTEKVYIASTKMATFVCPKCQKSKTVNVSKYADLDKNVKVSVRCPCGYAYVSILEKRKRYRKETNLPGSYSRNVDGKQLGGGLMIVKDLSIIGMKLQIDAENDCEVGDVIQVEFHTDDAQRAHIQKKLIIRNINGKIIGTELAPTEGVDKALGFYLFNYREDVD